jgi:PLD-like domain
MRILHDALRPPDGHELEHLLATTFTLDLVSLLSIPLAFTWFGGHGDTDAIERDPLELLAAVERQSGRITVFHQADAIGVPGRHKQLFPLIEEALVPVPAPRNGGVFHPKLWVATYADEAGKRRYRLLCLSRNLTPDRCWDTILSLEGAPARSARPESKPLSDFVGWLAGMRRLTPGRKTQIRRLARALSSVRFEPPEPFKHVSFRPLGIRGYRNDPITEARRDRMLVVSPFIGANQLEKLCAGAPDAILVTRPEELGRLQGTLPSTVSRVLRLDDALEAEPEEGADATPWLAGLHAKTYVADQGWNATVWTGSANATSAAFRNNIEFLVELNGKKSACGIDKILGDGSPGTFSSMLVPCDDATAPDEDDTVERELEAAARLVAELQVEVGTADDETGWQLELRLIEKSPPLMQGVRIGVAPLAAERGMLRVDLSKPLLASFHGLKAHEVSGLFVVELELAAHPGVTRSFVASWPLVGTVPDRVRGLLAELASDPARLLAFIRMFLSGGGEISAPSAEVIIGEGGANGWGAAASDEPLLELFIRALAREPHRLDELARWLPDIAAAAGDGAGAELLQIWEPVWQARQEAGQ